MKRHTRVTTMAVCALGIPLAACGGSSTLSRTALVAKANAICATAQTSAKQVAQPTSIAQATTYFDKIAPITDKETANLKALKPDSSVSADWNAFIDAQVAANTLLQSIRKKLDAKDASGIQELRQVDAVAQRVVSAATKLGATTCTQ
jgi:hypothetical protein